VTDYIEDSAPPPPSPPRTVLAHLPLWRSPSTTLPLSAIRPRSLPPKQTQLMKQLQHPNVVSVLGCGLVPDDSLRPSAPRLSRALSQRPPKDFNNFNTTRPSTAGGAHGLESPSGGAAGGGAPSPNTNCKSGSTVTGLLARFPSRRGGVGGYSRPASRLGLTDGYPGGGGGSRASSRLPSMTAEQVAGMTAAAFVTEVSAKRVKRSSN
jgi:hypothetical protein